MSFLSQGKACTNLEETLQNGALAVDSIGKYFYKDIASYKCDNGYEIEGQVNTKQNTVMCQANGQYDPLYKPCVRTLLFIIHVHAFKLKQVLGKYDI